MTDLPTLPTDPTVVEFGERNTARPCGVCDDEADYYVFVTNRRVNERLGLDLGYDEWPVDRYLCTGCFRDAPRVTDWENLSGVEA